MTRRISMFVGLLLVAGTFTVLTAPAEARGVHLSLYNTGTRYVGQLVPMRGYLNYAGTKHNKNLLLQKFYKGKWYTVERKLNRANGGFRFRGRTYTKPVERYYRVVAKKRGKTIKLSRNILVRVKKRTDPTPPTPPGGGNPPPVVTPPTYVAPNIQTQTSGSAEPVEDRIYTKPGTGSYNNIGYTVHATEGVGWTVTIDLAKPDATHQTLTATGSGSVTKVKLPYQMADAPAGKYTLTTTLSSPSFDSLTEEPNNDFVLTAPGTVPATAVLPDLQMKSLTKCGAGDVAHTAAMGGVDCFFTEGDGADRMLKFGAITLNTGAGRLEVNSTRSDPTTGTASWSGAATQRIYNADGKVIQDKPTDIEFYWEQLDHGTDDHGHTHWHMTDFDEYQLTGGGKSLFGEKHGFCFEDNTSVGSDKPKYYTQTLADDGKTTCGFEQPDATSIIHGLSSGWGDTYPSTLADQGIVIGDLADGTYTVTVTADANDHITESNESNNTASASVTLTDGQVTKVVASGGAS